MLDSTTIRAFSDERIKIARRERMEKGQFKKFLKSLAIVGAGAAVGHGAGTLLGMGAKKVLRKEIARMSRRQKAMYVGRLPRYGMALSGLAALATMARRERLGQDVAK